MAFDFPASPSNGSTYSPAGGPTYVYQNGVWLQQANALPAKTARRKNYARNASMEVSQENGNNPVSAAGAYPVDIWSIAYGGFALQAAQSASFISPDNSRWSLATSFSATRPSPGAADLAVINGSVEGIYAADFEWGTANAKPAVLRFNAACETAGSYSVGLVNLGANDQSWLGRFDCDGSTLLKTYSFAIPAMATGTWAKDTTAGIGIRFCYGTGSTYGGGVAGWQSGNRIAGPWQTNGATVSAKNLFITDIGLYLDPDNTGIAPPFEIPSYASELVECQRQFYVNPSFQMAGYNIASNGTYVTMPHKVTMRAAPSISYTTTTSSNCSAADVRNATTDSVLLFAVIAASGSFVFNGNYRLSARI